jgi:FKBP12-rapamycin complex-associated protein
VGYLLGLGDRHPSNLMLHRSRYHIVKKCRCTFLINLTASYILMFCCSGKILHIDFGDCFESSMNREKFPEKVSQFIVIIPHVCGFLLVPILIF